MMLHMQHLQPSVLHAPVHFRTTPFRAVRPAAAHQQISRVQSGKQRQQQRQTLRTECRRRHLSTVHATAAPDASKYEDADYDKLADEIRELADVVKEQLGGTSLYLVGMMGSGKSTVGKLLSQALGYYFFDLDSLVEAHARMTVKEIFEQEGEEAFREVETAVLQELAPFRDCVVATGGGAVLSRANWGHMSHAVSVWLDGPPPLLAARLVADGTASRPLVAGSEGDDEYAATVAKLQDLLTQRKGKYSAADMRISLAHPQGDANRSAAPAVVLSRVLSTLKEQLTTKKADLEAKRQSVVVAEQAADQPAAAAQPEE